MTCVKKTRHIFLLVINNRSKQQQKHVTNSHGNYAYYLKFQKFQSNGISFMENVRVIVTFLQKKLDIVLRASAAKNQKNHGKVESWRS